MNISGTRPQDLLDLVAAEGDPELLFAPLTQPPADLPPGWAKVLSDRDVRGAVARLWEPMRDRLPRVYRALQERLRGVGLLRTDEVPASLIYFFGDGDYSFEFRGRQPLTGKRLTRPKLPADFIDFYRIHDGWVHSFSEDNGPAPSRDWPLLGLVWPEMEWPTAPGDGSVDDSILVFRIGDECAFAFDTSVSPPRPMVYQNSGDANHLLDMWTAIDQQTGALLEEADRIAPPVAVSRSAIERRDRILKERDRCVALDPHRGGPAIHRQAFELLLMRAAQQQAAERDRLAFGETCRQALDAWCSCVEAGGDTDPIDVRGAIGLAHVVGDSNSAAWILEAPPLYESIEQTQLDILFHLFHGALESARSQLDELDGLTFGDDNTPSAADRIAFRLLESMTKGAAADYAKWRKEAMEQLVAPVEDPVEKLKAQFALFGFDAPAHRLGLWNEPVSF